MKLLITGTDGFIGRNLCVELLNRGFKELLLCNRNTTELELRKFVSQCTAIIHLAGENRPKVEKEFWEGNVENTRRLLSYLKESKNTPHIIFTSSIQAESDTPYGKSKLEAEQILKKYSYELGFKLTIYRLPNVFGKWCKPFYNSVVATFCYKIARGEMIEIHNPDTIIPLVYIDDVIDAILGTLEIQEELYPLVKPVYKIKIERLAEMLYSFNNKGECLNVPNVGDEFTKKLYSTYLSYLKDDVLKVPLYMNIDERGSFTEFIRTGNSGQVSVNIIKKGIVKGQHWHNTKIEKFLVVRGTALIRMRNKLTNEMVEYVVSGSQFEMLYIPPGYVHSIANIGEEELITVIWANENFDKGRPDTYYEEV